MLLHTGVKSRFFEQLQDVLDGVPNSEIVMLELVCLTLKMICGKVLWVGMDVRKEICW